MTLQRLRDSVTLITIIIIIIIPVIITKQWSLHTWHRWRRNETCRMETWEVIFRRTRLLQCMAAWARSKKWTTAEYHDKH